MGNATISLCGRYRYSLSRMVRDGEGKGTLAIVMLNPSTADASVDDPTIRRCMNFARDNGYSGIHVVNLYAYRATNPQELKRVVDPIGLDNDHYLKSVGKHHKLILCAWGRNAPIDRVREVTPLLTYKGAELVCLGVNADLSPKHPLYVTKTAVFQPWETPQAIPLPEE